MENTEDWPLITNLESILAHKKYRIDWLKDNLLRMEEFRLSAYDENKLSLGDQTIISHKCLYYLTLDINRVSHAYKSAE